MKMMRFWVAVVSAVLSWVLFAGVVGTTPTQVEVDEIVENEMFKYMHEEDYRSAVRYWKNKGVTDEMFGRSYVKIARRTMNEPVKDDNKCYRSINGIAEFCKGEMLRTNLLYLAEHVTYDRDHAHAIRTLWRNVPATHFTAFAERVVASTNLGHHAGSQLMSCLSDAYPKVDVRNNVWKERILQVLRRHLEIGGKGSVIADRTLLDYDKEYEKSEFRKKVAERMLDPRKSPLNGDDCVNRHRVEEEMRRVLRKGNER